MAGLPFYVQPSGVACTRVIWEKPFFLSRASGLPPKPVSGRFPFPRTLVSIPANPVPDGAMTGTIKTSDGAELRFARWSPPLNRKGTVCVFQGRGEYMEKYFETVRDLRERGFAVA